jgi:hypothetical protein
VVIGPLIEIEYKLVCWALNDLELAEGLDLRKPQHPSSLGFKVHKMPKIPKLGITKSSEVFVKSLI